MSSGPDDGTRTGPLLRRKEQGVAVLVTGAVPDAVHRSMSARLLGSPTEDRRRVLALTSHDEDAVADRLPAGADRSPDHLRAVLGDGWTRSATVSPTAASLGDADADVATPQTPSSDHDATTGKVPERGLTVLTDPSLSTFGERLSREMSVLDSRAGSFDPGQLRLCVDSLDHLTEEYDDDEVLRFAHLIADQVRTSDGMVHFHTRREYDALVPSDLEAVADVVVRLRVVGETPEFRPYLDGDPLTDWASIPPVPE